MIKLIASDLDGTLLDEPNRISKINQEAIEYAYNKGAKFCIATGRDLAAAKEIIDSFKHRPVLLLGNGSEVYDENKKLLFQDFVDNKYLNDILSILHSHNLPHMIFTTDGFYTTMDPEWVQNKFIERLRMIRNKQFADSFKQNPNKPCNNLVFIRDLEKFKKEKKILKVEGFYTNPTPVEKVKKDLERFTELSHLSTGPNNVEITNLSATKGLALKKYCELSNIHPDEVMVLGDSHNDLSLFEHFKYSFAPENSVAEVKEKAYRIVKSCDNHGVSDAIYGFIK